jgi:hypothetical protein
MIKYAGGYSMNIFEQMTAQLEGKKDRSAWGRGVNVYALELVEELEERAAYEGRNPEPGQECREWLLNGANDWSQYSWGGSALIYDSFAWILCMVEQESATVPTL